MSSMILYEDNHLLVVNKPGGLLTQPSGTEQDSLESQFKVWIKEKYQKPGNVFLEALHRLDKPVSGIVLFARTSKALSRLNESIRAKDFVKTYLALVEGRLSDEGILEHYLLHDEFQASVVTKTTPGAKLARLSYRVKKVEGDLTLVEVNLETGRYHQIRAQFSAIGSPIAGDRKYGSKIPFKEGLIALHHHRLEFSHPISRERIVCVADAPF